MDLFLSNEFIEWIDTFNGRIIQLVISDSYKIHHACCLTFSGIFLCTEQTQFFVFLLLEYYITFIRAWKRHHPAFCLCSYVVISRLNDYSWYINNNS